MTDFHFTTDWFSQKIPAWETYFASLKGKEDIHFLEIGCWEGRASCWLLQNVLTHPSSSLTCIDPFPHFSKERIEEYAVSWGLEPPYPNVIDSKKNFLHNIDVTGQMDQVIIRHDTSENVLPTLQKDHFDFVYIDGSHYAAHVLADAVLSWPLLRIGGLLIFDDYQLETRKDPHNNPRTGIDAFLSVYKNHYDLVDKGWQVVIRKKEAQWS